MKCQVQQDFVTNAADLFSGNARLAGDVFVQTRLEAFLQIECLLSCACVCMYVHGVYVWGGGGHVWARVCARMCTFLDMFLYQIDVTPNLIKKRIPPPDVILDGATEEPGNIHIL